MTRIFIVFVLVLFNGFFAMSEMAVMTSRRSRLRQMAQHSRRAAKALHLAEHPEGFLSAVQLWITLLGLLTGYFGGESIGTQIEGPIARAVPLLAPWAHGIGFVTGFVVMVFLYGVIGELVPKRIATLFPEKLATHVAYPIHVLAISAKPGVLMLSFCTRTLLRLMGLRKTDGERVSTEEIRLLVSEGHEQGAIDEDERNMMHRVLRLGDRSAGSLMTPRTQIAWLDAAASAEENLAVMKETSYSQYPVYRGSDSDVIGVLEMKTLAIRMGEKDIDVFAELRPPVFVAESTRSLGLLEIFRDEQQTLALVVDEYGEIQGLVTLEDLMGAVIGRLQTAESSDPDEMPIVEREDGSWLVDGGLAMDDLRELLSITATAEDEEQDYHTVAGMVIAHFGRIPHAGEYFVWKNVRIEVVDLDGARVDKLLIARIAKPSLGEGNEDDDD
ncbi:MAG TPA: hemolysin family protein [Xanthomonadaceae bacterium]|jgi:putative hemolysin|nr:hemolysin family protein [Xanthomonadaceae bacterium]